MNFAELIESATKIKRKTIAVAQAADLDVLQAVTEASSKGIADFILIGQEAEITELLKGIGSSTEEFHIIDEPNIKRCCQLAVQLVRDGEADIVMKGLVSTADLLKAVLSKEHGLRASDLISHVAAFEVEHYDRLILVTDSAMNIAPSLTEKAAIIENAVKVAHSLGISCPKVAPVCAVEVVNPNMPSTLDAAALALMNQRGQLKGCVVDGPLALDNALSLEAATHKGIVSEVAGYADILAVPSIEVGNILYKSLIYFAKAKVGAIIVGAKAPIILTSRADSAEAKLYSIALASLYADQENR
ncbi:phosphate butyryltransferase [Bacillus horti]|uniref:Phosphate butyryltransferase n=1 Tax=Caldalkalibacillus horti TaxID=77523 RepID=A0ABT9W0W9_9BACI|nr:phosphate butyryltransferase [Bacillus horti]MDQ0166856.1 phosphate butyryltransferase [Bacillus horti]